MKKGAVSNSTRLFQSKSVYCSTLKITPTSHASGLSECLPLLYAGRNSATLKLSIVERVPAEWATRAVTALEPSVQATAMEQVLASATTLGRQLLIRTDQ